MYPQTEMINRLRDQYYLYLWHSIWSTEVQDKAPVPFIFITAYRRHYS